MRFESLVIAVLIGLPAAAQEASPRVADQPTARDWYFGESIYYAQQGHYFEALERLDAELGQHRGVDEPALDSLYRNLKEAEFDIGDFELNYRMHYRAGRAITAVLEGAVDEQVRNELLLTLGAR